MYIIILLFIILINSISFSESRQIEQALRDRNIHKLARELSKSKEITTTSRIAQKLGYHNFINELANKGQHILDTAENRHQKVLIKLSAQNRLRAAEENSNEFKSVRANIDNKLENAIHTADKLLIIQGRRLDDINAPINDKIKLVLKAKKMAQDAFNKEIKRA